MPADRVWSHFFIEHPRVNRQGRINAVERFGSMQLFPSGNVHDIGLCRLPASRSCVVMAYVCKSKPNAWFVPTKDNRHA